MMRVLVVDDAAFMRMTLKQILLECGFEVAGEAVNGQEAVKMYESVRPDIVTMDITMPEMDGIQALKTIRGIDPAAKIVMCSAMGQQGMVVEAIQSGAKDFVVKPFQKERVAQALQKALK